MPTSPLSGLAAMTDGVGKFNLKVVEPDTSTEPIPPSRKKEDWGGYRVGAMQTRPNVMLSDDLRRKENAPISLGEGRKKGRRGA